MNILSFKLKSKTNSNIFIVETDDGEFVLHSDIIVKYNLEKGEVDSSKFFEATQESENLIAFNLVTKYLGGKLKTEKQIKDYLYKKEYHKPCVETVINKLLEYKIIDDEMYAESYIRSNPNYSVNKLKQKLMMSGVKNEIISNLLQDKDDEESCFKHATKFLKNKELDSKTKEKLIRNLQSKGFGWDVISKTLNKLKCEIED